MIIDRPTSRPARFSNIPDHLITRLSQFVQSEMGLHFPESRRRNLERGIRAAVEELAREYQINDDPVMCIHRLLSSRPARRHLDILAEHLTIGETYFFRDKSLFHALGNHILPELIRCRGKERHLRFWSAGCCTGEEPYSLAILIDQLIPAWQEWKIMILATDINGRFLQKAEKGIYTRWSFRNTPEEIMEKYFTTREKNRFEISSHLKEMVTFDQYNLAEKGGDDLQRSVPDRLVTPGNRIMGDHRAYLTDNMDAIFCRNVLMYLVPELRGYAVNHFAKSLSEGSWLVVSPSETVFVRHSALRLVGFPEAILYKKQSL